MTDVTDNLYENLDIDSGNRFKPERAGDCMEILLTKIERHESKVHRNDDGTAREGLIFFGADPAGVDIEWAAWSARAKHACLVDKPQVGDLIRVTYLGEEQMSGGLNPAKNWQVEVLLRKDEVGLDEHGFPVEF
jgi:hypothetical protein